MITCKYCGEELRFLGEYNEQTYFNCNFCDLTFPYSETSQDRKRKMSVPEHYNDNYNQSTKEFLEIDTLGLYHVLKDIRTDWYNIKNILEKLKLINNDNEIPLLKSDDDETFKTLKKQFIELTKKKFVVENIILERTGYLVPKITEQFLSEIVTLGKHASNKAMFVYIK